MVHLYGVGAETGLATLEHTTVLSGSTTTALTYNSAVKRSGTYSFLINSGVSNFLYGLRAYTPGSRTIGTTYYDAAHFMFIDAPTATTKIGLLQSTAGANLVSVRVTTGGKIQLWNDVAGTQIGSDSSETIAFDSTTWHRIELGYTIASGAGDDYAELKLNGTTVASVSGATISTAATYSTHWGWCQAPGASKSIRLDDLAGNDNTGASNNSWVGNVKVVLLLPISDNARAAKWTGGAGGTTNLWDAVNNLPPVGLASASATNTSQIEHAGSGVVGEAYDANLQTYASAGLVSGDTVLGTHMVYSTGEDIGTGTKLLAFSNVSNPTAATPGNVTAGADAGAIGTWPTNWQQSLQPISPTNMPTVTIANSPVMRVARPETASRVASVALMALYVAYQPSAGADATGTVSAQTIPVTGSSITGTFPVGATGTVALDTVPLTGSSITGTAGIGATGTVALDTVPVAGSSISATAGIGATGTVAASTVVVAGSSITGTYQVSATGTVALDTIPVAGSSVTATAGIGATGTVSAQTIIVAGSSITGTASSVVDATGTVSAQTIPVAGSSISATAAISATGTVALDTIPVTGSSITGTAGALGTVSAQTIPVAGSSITGTAGTVVDATGTVAADTVPVTGSSITSTYGSLGTVAADTIPVTGSSITGTAGSTVDATGTVAGSTVVVAGSSITGTAQRSDTGTVASQAIAVTGSTINGTAGTVIHATGTVAADTIPVAGSAITASAGIGATGTVATDTVPVTGSAITATAGTSATGTVSASTVVVSGSAVTASADVYAQVLMASIAVTGSVITGTIGVPVGFALPDLTGNITQTTRGGSITSSTIGGSITQPVLSGTVSTDSIEGNIT